jgi:hypothetical protein
MEEDLIFVYRPLALLNARIQMIKPPLPTLLANAPWQLFGNGAPLDFTYTALEYSLPYNAVLFLRPGPLVKPRLEYLVPAM